MSVVRSPRSRTTSLGAATAERIADAAVTVVARDGFDVLSVRTVAREAGVSGGTVQHHYDTRNALLLAAFAHTVDAITSRLIHSDLAGAVQEVVTRLCEQALPLDDERRRECIVWTALSAAASTHPELAHWQRRAVTLFTATLASIIRDARTAGELPQSCDPDVAAAVLVAVVDGLTLHGVAHQDQNSTAILWAAITALLE
ncbi:MAG: TetR/AcrR family transcriptional regulator [Nakamurella sp.]